MEFDKSIFLGFAAFGIGLGAILLGIILLGGITFLVSSYNSLITKQEEVLSSWAQVESNLQRRIDLIPNLVSSVKSYMEHEQQVFSDVSSKRAGGLSEIVSALESLTTTGELTSLSGQIKTKLADQAFMKSLVAEQQKVGQNINKLMGVVENYPELRSSDQFIVLQAQLEGTENRINVTRMIFNDAVGDFNASISKIPAKLIADFAGLERKAYFRADESSKEPLTVDFEP